MEEERDKGRKFTGTNLEHGGALAAFTRVAMLPFELRLFKPSITLGWI